MRGLLIILDILIFAFFVAAHLFMAMQVDIDEVAIKKEADATSNKNLDKLNKTFDEASPDTIHATDTVAQ